MTRNDAIAHYGSQAAIARAIGLTRAAVGKWGDEIPHVWQCVIEVETGGRLKADRKGFSPGLSVDVAA